MSSGSQKTSKHGSKSSAKARSKQSGGDSSDKSNREWSEWYWEESFKCEIRNRQKPDGEWEYEYSMPQDVPAGTVPRSSVVPLTSPTAQPDSLRDDESLHPSSPGYITYKNQFVPSAVDSTNPLTQPLLSPGEYASSRGSTARQGSISTSPTMSSLTQQFSNLNPSSTSQGSTMTTWAAEGPSQNIGKNPFIDSSVPQQQSAYGGAVYMSVPYGQSTGAQPTVDPYYGLTAQLPQGPMPLLSSPLATNDSLVAGPPGTSLYQTFPLQGNREKLSKMSKGQSEGSEHYIRPDIGPIAKAPLNKDFKIEYAREFTFGRVFKILWAEPTGQVAGEHAPSEVFKIKHGQEVYAKIRRFIVVKQLQGHCLCLPILTYQRQATKKHGVKPQDHSIIYSESKAKLKQNEKAKVPTELPGEERLSKRPIRIVSYSPREHLDECSRLNYAKIYTVEYNLRVCFVGTIHDKSVKYFKRDYNNTHQPLPQDQKAEYSDDEARDEEGEEDEKK